MTKDLTGFHPHLPEKTDNNDGIIERGDTNNLLPTPNEIVSLLSRRVIGHEQAKRTLAVAVYQHLMQCAHADAQGHKHIESENHVMLVGPTGSGKSLLLRTLGDVLKIPIYYASCTQLVPSGYKGQDLYGLLDTMAGRIVDDEFTHPALAVWDEVDKLSIYDGPARQESAAGVYRRMTQTDFLTFLDGANCGGNGKNRRMDNSRILNVACGAFVGLDEIRKPKPAPEMGFHSAVGREHGHLPPIRPEHLIQFGLIPEFVGRFTRLATLDPLDRSVMRRILTEAEGSVLARRKEFYGLHGILLEITDEAIDVVIDRSMSHDTGARALRLVIDQVLRSLEHRLPDMTEEGVKTVLIDRDAVMGRSAPIEHKGNTPVPSSLIELRRAAAFTDRLKPQCDSDDDDELSCF